MTYAASPVRASGRPRQVCLDMLLPASRASTTFAGVELACASAGVGLGHFGQWRSLPRQQAAIGVSAVAGPSPVRSVGAHSSIGQSPRLITGLFLVRIQVGPPRGHSPVPDGVKVGSSGEKLCRRGATAARSFVRSDHQ